MTSPNLAKLPVDAIEIADNRRAVDRKTVAVLKESLSVIGLQSPIIVKRTVSEDGVHAHTLVAGRHRLEAARGLGWSHIDCIVKTQFSAVEAEMWEIAENLHRAELTVLERSEQIARWVELQEKVLAQVETKPQGGRPEGGIRAASRELGIQRNDANRSSKVAGLSAEAKQAAREIGLDDNRSALLEAVKEPTPEAQVAYLRERKPLAAADSLNDFEAVERQVAALMVAWNKAAPKARETFLARIDTPVMGKQWA